MTSVEEDIETYKPQCYDFRGILKKSAFAIKICIWFWNT